MIVIKLKSEFEVEVDIILIFSSKYCLGVLKD
jgi:hypothetical protein